MATYNACRSSINRLVILPVSARIDSSISCPEMSRCESILSLPTLPSFPVLPLVPPQNRHRHHHPSSPVPSTPSPSPLLPYPPPRTCNPHSPSHHLAHTEPPTTAARLASCPSTTSRRPPQTQAIGPQAMAQRLTTASGSTPCPHRAS